jgi:Sulfotransferase family
MHKFRVRSVPEYERLFAEAGDAVAIGEASTMYLECPQSATRIHWLLPAARIICSLRHPLGSGVLGLSDVPAQLWAQARSGPRPRATPDGACPDSHWIRIGRYYEQLRRYYEAFPGSQIYVILFDDLKRDPLRVVQELYRFRRGGSGFQAGPRDEPQHWRDARQPIAGAASHEEPAPLGPSPRRDGRGCPRGV